MDGSLRLYHYPLSPFCRKLRLVLAEKKVEVSLIEEKFWERRPEFLLLNPAGKVPVLRGRGMIFSDSQATSEYLEARFPDPCLIPDDPLIQYEMRRLIFWFDEKFYQEVTQPLLFERMLRNIQRKGSPDGRALASALRSLRFHKRFVCKLLRERRWLAGKSMTLADFTAAAHFSCLDFLNDIDWSVDHDFKNWYAAIKSRPAFRPLLADYIPGYAQPAHYTDLDF